MEQVIIMLGEGSEPGEQVPAVSIYRALGSDYPAYWAAVQSANRAGFLRLLPGEKVTLTPKGREAASILAN